MLTLKEKRVAEKFKTTAKSQDIYNLHRNQKTYPTVRFNHYSKDASNYSVSSYSQVEIIDTRP